MTPNNSLYCKYRTRKMIFPLDIRECTITSVQQSQLNSLVSVTFDESDSHSHGQMFRVLVMFHGYHISILRVVSYYKGTMRRWILTAEAPNRASCSPVEFRRKSSLATSRLPLIHL